MAIPDSLLTAAFEQSRAPLAVVDEYGKLAIWNRAFEALFRAVAGSGPERLASSLFDFVAEREGLRFDYYAARVLLGGSGESVVESPIRTFDGGKRWLRFSLSLLEAPGAAPGGRVERFLLCSIEDATDRVIREQRLRSAKDEAEKATHTKSQFLANMSHEIRTPIQTILGVVELLDETSLDGEQAEYVNQVRFSAEVLLGLVNDVLDFSKIEAGKLDLETTTFDLRACVRQSVDLLAMDAHRKGLEIVVDLDDALPALVRGDPGRLRQIIVNLFKNAVKFTRRGGITLSLGLVEGRRGPSMRFEVADTGPGVPPDVRDRLFTPFYQGELGQARKTGGTGLGLAISRHLAELMGGAIGLAPAERRAPGETAGSTFWFEVPLVVPEYSTAPRPASIGQGTRLLVVDDHAGARAFAAKTARASGFRVAEAESGEEALVLLRGAAAGGDPFAVCLIDQAMPQMDGWRLASEITGDIAINSARLILMAPVGTIGADAKMMLLRWFNGYIYKPVKPHELVDALSRALSSEVDLESPEAAAEPPAAAGPAAGPPPAAAASGAAGSPEGAAEAAAERFDAEILIAEDHEVNRELFSILLAKLGCRVSAASDGVEAVELGRSKSFDLVLMDVFMPRMDGYEATRELRSAGFSGPIVAITASALKGEREKCIEAGMDDILVKPFKRSDLIDLLRARLPARAGGAATEGCPPPEGGGSRPSAGGGEEEAEGSVVATAPGDPAVFDWDAAVDTFLGQSETVRGLVARFVAKARGQVDELDAALAAGDLARFREIAHSMKGASLNLSARRLGDAAARAEQAGRDGDADAASAALVAVRAEFSAFERAASGRCAG